MSDMGISSEQELAEVIDDRSTTRSTSSSRPRASTPSSTRSSRP